MGWLTVLTIAQSHRRHHRDGVWPGVRGRLWASHWDVGVSTPMGTLYLIYLVHLVSIPRIYCFTRYMQYMSPTKMCQQCWLDTDGHVMRNYMQHPWPTRCLGVNTSVQRNTWGVYNVSSVNGHWQCTCKVLEDCIVRRIEQESELWRSVNTLKYAIMCQQRH